MRRDFSIEEKIVLDGFDVPGLTLNIKRIQPNNTISVLIRSGEYKHLMHGYEFNTTIEEIVDDAMEWFERKRLPVE